MRKKRILSVVAAICLSMSFLVGCTGNKEKDKKTNANENTTKTEKKVVKIGAYGSHPPYNYMEGDKLVGYEVDIWEEIAKRNNLELQYTNSSNVAALFGMLDSEKIDTILCQVSITDERKEKYNFTTPYMYNPGGWFVNKDEEGINKLEDLFGKKVGVVAGGSDIELYKKLDPQGKIKQVVYQEHAAAIKDVENKRLDAVGVSIPQGSYMIKQSNLNLKVVGNNGIKEENAFPILKGKNDDLLKMVSQTIEDMKKEGVLKELSMKWFGTDTTIENQNQQ